MFFLDNVNCYEIFFNSSQFGFKILLTTLTIEIRSIKNAYESLKLRQKEKLFKYNCSLMGTDKEKNLFPNSDTNSEEYLSYIEMHPINVYNSEENYVINRIYRYILSNTFPLFGNKFSKEIVNGINYIKNFFIVIIFVFIFVKMLLYIFVWIPYENKINTVIYKTKNMLMIIPIDILRNMPSVYKVLDIYVSNQTNTFDRSKNIIE